MTFADLRESLHIQSNRFTIVLSIHKIYIKYYPKNETSGWLHAFSA
jgi:hypothetical protein